MCCEKLRIAVGHVQDSLSVDVRESTLGFRRGAAPERRADPRRDQAAKMTLVAQGRPLLGRATRAVPLSAGGWQGRLVSRVSPIARCREFCRGRGSRPGAPASKSGRDGGPRARTCKRTWSLRLATCASNYRERTLQPGDSERTKEHPTTSAGTARRFSCARQQPASWCSGGDQVAADTSNEVRNASAT